jgi:hypothetical protein
MIRFAQCGNPKRGIAALKPRFVTLRVIVAITGLLFGLSVQPVLVHAQPLSRNATRMEARRAKSEAVDSLNGKVEIRLRSRKFTPPEDVVTAIQSHVQRSGRERVHVLMQFHDIPDTPQRGILGNASISLLNYVPRKAWFASVPRGVTQAQLAGANVRWIGPILPEDKVFPPILNRGVGSWAVNEDGSVNLEVSFFDDVSLDEARELLVGMGAVIKEESAVSNRLTITVSPDRLMDIANEDIVRWIIEERPPKIEFNDGSRANVGADDVQGTPYNLSGAGVDVGIWDGGAVDSTHDDFGTRVTVADSVAVGDHATHVAGTMSGDGTLSESAGGTAYQWRGTAPQIDVISYYWDDNIIDHEGAIDGYGIEISQNSWGSNMSVIGYEYLGYYGWDAYEYDDIVGGLYGDRICVVFAAGNDRDNVAYDYDTVAPPSTAKNIISVGAINSDNNSMTVFSGWGPTDDGRIKPDVVAPGDEAGGEGYIRSTLPGDTYGGSGWYGTSMAAPCVSGCASLIIEDYRSLYSGQDPLPSTIKALLMHEANDLGNTGPDYSYGYGGIQIQDSIDTLRTQSLVEDEVGHDATDTHALYVPSGTTEVKITLVWDDQPGLEGAASALVNDLDLVVRDPDGVRHYPWTLDPGNPSNAAVRTQEDHTNNVEQVVVDGSITPGEWTVEVYGYDVPYALQEYSLVFSPNYWANVMGTIYKDAGYSDEESFFDEGDTVYIEAYIVSDGSPVTGASVTADLELGDATPVVTIALIDSGGGYYRNSWNSAGATADVYSVHINVADPPFGTSEYFHVYPQTGVSAYRLDYDEDGNDDYVLENEHLIAVYDGRTNTDRLLLRLIQKDTDTEYTLAEITDANSVGTSEVTTSSVETLRFSSFLFSSEGESLGSTSLQIQAETIYIPPLNILIIDDDGALGGTDSAARCNTVLSDLGHTTTLESSSSTDSGTWADYDLLVWGSSDDTSPINNRSTSTRDALVAYVNGGGRLVLEGGELGYVATYYNWSAFMSDVLHIPDRWYGDGANLGAVELESLTPSHPVRTTPNDLPYVINIYPGTGNDYGSADGIEALSDSVTVYAWDALVGTSSGNPVGGIVAFDDDTDAGNGGQIVYMSFDLLQIDSPTDEADLIENVVEWVSPVAEIASLLDLAIQMNTGDVDYLVYRLFNFDANIDDIMDVFSPISGSLGSSVDDDRYHIGDSTDGLVNSLASETWTDFGALTDEQRYVAIYDDSLPGDGTDDNVVSWVYFPNSATVSFQGVGCWYETDREGLRIRYDTSSAAGTNEAEYVLVFTQGDYSTIDQWMSTVAGGSLPEPNFVTPPVVLGIEITSDYLPDPKLWNIGPLDLHDIVESDTFTVENTGNVAEDMTVMGDDEDSNSWYLADALGPDDVFEVEVDNDGDPEYDFTLLDAVENPLATDVPAGDDTTTFKLRYSAPHGDTLGGGVAHDFTVTIKASVHVE